MNTQTTLRSYIGTPVLGVAACYCALQKTDVYICGVEVLENDTLLLTFPKGHQLSVGDKLTLHLDNRTGVDEYDADLKVYRCSYKGQVAKVRDNQVLVTPIECELYYGITVVYRLASADYQHPEDTRPELALPITPLTTLPVADLREVDNKIGVLVTGAQSQPHTTVLAFLSSDEDDIFFITFPSTFKAKLLKRDRHCHFVIDSRAVFTYTQAIEWNYTIIEADAYQIPPSHPLFEPIREAFVQKNPWEVGFFSHPHVELYHLKPKKVVCPTQAK
jgi:hypothetical protein